MEIEKLTLYIHHFNELWNFYNESLGLLCHKISEDAFKVTTLRTILEFHQSEVHQYYHFAFLIPSGTLKRAISYLESRKIELLLLEGEKIVHFEQGRAVYFKDPDGNIVEWIERPSVPEANGLEFHPQNLVCVNEIGFPVSDPRKISRILMDDYGIVPNNSEGFSDQFCWVGDARGVLIVVKIGRNWLPTDIASMSNEFIIRYKSSKGNFRLEISGNEIKPLTLAD